MFEQDYLVRMILQFAEGIARSMDRARGKHDPLGAAELLELSIGEATDLDMGVLLSLSPDSIADILQVSGTDPHVVEYISRSLILAGKYFAQAGDNETSRLRTAQGEALARAYALDLDTTSDPEQAMEEFLQSSK